MEKKFKVQKIPLESLLDTLDKLWALWQEGVEYVDVEATVSAKRDKLEFFVRDEYISPSPFFSTDEYEQLIYLGP